MADRILAGQFDEPTAEEEAAAEAAVRDAAARAARPSLTEEGRFLKLFCVRPDGYDKARAARWHNESEQARLEYYLTHSISGAAFAPPSSGLDGKKKPWSKASRAAHDLAAHQVLLGWRSSQPPAHIA